MPMTTEDSEKTRSTLPSEVVTQEILPRLPAKSVGRCRCVCRLWHSLISEPFFINKHLLQNNINSSAEEDSGHILVGYGYPGSLWLWEPLSEAPKELKLPKKVETFEFEGSSNGLLCFRLRWYRDRDDHCEETILWNPLINKYKTLPLLPQVASPKPPAAASSYHEYQPLQESGYERILGFGFLPQLIDFKVVQLVLCRSSGEDDHLPLSSFAPTVEVYTLGTDSWTTKTTNGGGSGDEDINILQRYQVPCGSAKHSTFVNYEEGADHSWRRNTTTSGGGGGDEDIINLRQYEVPCWSAKHATFVNEALHWMAFRVNDGQDRSWPPSHAQLVLSFDMVDEMFREITLPVQRGCDDYEISTFHNLLALLVGVGRPVQDVWVMTDYGVTASWTRKYRINTTGTGTGTGEYMITVIPRGFTKNDEVLTNIDEHQYQTLASYDPNTQKITNILEQGMHITTAATYKESLAVLN